MMLHFRRWLPLVPFALVLISPSLPAQEVGAEKFFTGHLDAVTMGGFTPEGGSVVTVSFDKTARLWDIASQSELRQYTQHTAPIYCLAVSGDGTTLVTGAQDNTLRIWDLPLGEPLRVIDEHKEQVNAIALSPGGDSLVSASADRSVRIHAIGENEPQTTTRSAHASEVVAVAYRSDGAYFASSDTEGHVLLWSPYLDEPQGELLSEKGIVTQLGFVSNNQQLLAACDDGVVRVLQSTPTTPETSILREMPIHEGPIRSMALYAGGSQVLTCGDDRRIVMTNVSNGAEVRPYRVKEEAEPAASGEESQQQPLYREIVPTVVATRIDNQRVAAGTETGAVFVWSVNNGETPILNLHVKSPVTAIAYSADSQKLAVSDAEQRIHVFGPSIPGTQPSSELTLHQQITTDAAVTDLVFAPDDRSLWASLDSGQIQRWNYAGIAQRRQMNHGGPVYGVALSHDGQVAVSCSTDQTVRVWDTNTGRQKSSLSGHRGAVHAIAMSRDETFVVSSGADGTLRLWDIVGGRQLKQLTQFDATMYSIAIHPVGRLIAAAGADRKIHLLDLITGDQRHTLEGHEDYVHCVTFDATGDRLLSYGYAGHLKIWNPSTGKLLHESRVGKIGNYAQFSPDGKKLLLSNGDATARVVPAP